MEHSPRYLTAARGRHRVAFVLGWVGGLMILVGIMAFGLWFVTTNARSNVARAIGGQAYMNICLSALAEARAKLIDAIAKREKIGALDPFTGFGKDYPFDAFEIPAGITQKLASAAYPGVVVKPVKVGPGKRPPAGWSDPLQGVIEMSVEVSGTIGGGASGREVTHLYVFLVPASFGTVPSQSGTYTRVHWGRPRFLPDPVATRIKSL